jgi:transposase
VTLALVLDSSGFVRESRSFAGNVSEGNTLEHMLKALNVPKGALVVMDAGIAKEENLTWLRDNGYRYLAVSRDASTGLSTRKSRQFDPEQAVSLENASGDRVRLQKIVDKDAGEARLYCHSEGRERKEQAIAKRFADKFEAELQKLHDGLSKPRCETCAELVEVKKSQNSGSASDVLKPKVTALNWDETTFWRTYIMLTDLEGVFRSFKSELGLRPIYHHTEARVDGHLFITVLAYQFVQIIRKRLARHSWPLANSACHSQRPTARHRDLPSRRRLDAACAQSHPRGTGTIENLSSPQHQSSAGRCEKDARIT